MKEANESSPKKAEGQLRETEEYFKTTFDISPGLICIANAKTGYITDCNPAVKAILGFSVKKFTSTPFMEFVHPDDRHQTIDVMKKQVEGRKVVNFVNRYICEDGSIKWLAWQSTEADKDGKVYAVATDITEAKKAEEQLRESERKFLLIAEQMSDMVFVTDADGLINYASMACEDIFGFTYLEMLDQPFMKFLDEKEIPKAVQSFTKSISTGTSSPPLEMVMKRKDGSLFVGELNASFYKEQGIQGTVGTIRDVTERSKSDIAVREKIDELEGVNDITNGKEGTVIELKKEVNALLQRLKEPEKYKNVK